MSNLKTGLTHRIIPCLDVRDGRVVKGVKFQNLRDQGDPADSAARYAEQGADEIVFLDVSASPEGREADRDWIRRTAERVFIPLSVGGGVREVADAEKHLRSGADKVGVNTAAIANPQLIDDLARRFGSQCVVLSVDALRRAEGAPGNTGGASWEVVTHGGRQRQGRDAVEWIVEGARRGAGEILLTAIDADGTRDGYDLEILEAVCGRIDVPVIASGGAGKPEHLADALRAGAAAVLAASIFHQDTYTVGEIKRYLADRGFPMREEPR